MKLYKFYLLLIVCYLSSISVARGDYDFYTGGLYYRVLSLDDLTCSIVDPINTSNYIQHKSDYCGHITIPATIEFANRTFTVVEIAEYAFFQSSVYSIEIPGTVHTIHHSAFSMAENLHNVIINDGVKKIMWRAFSGCTNIVNLRLPNTLEEIGWEAFEESHKLQGIIYIPRTCWLIGEKAFGYGDYDIHIEDGDKELKIYKYGLGSGNKLYVGRNLIFDYWDTGIYCYNHIEFGDRVTNMPDSAYDNRGYNTRNIESLTIGKSIKCVPNFEDYEIKKIKLRGEIPAEAMGFRSNTYLHTTLYIPIKTIDAYVNAKVWKDFWNIVEYGLIKAPQ